MDLRPTLAAPDDDPYLWLEDVEGEAALRWTAEQSARTAALLTDGQYEADRAALLGVMDRPDRIAHVSRTGGLLYNFWRDAANPRGLWRRTTFAAYLSGDPAWDTLLDLDALAAAEDADWVWHGASTLPPTRDRALLRLSRGGGDAVVLREYDIPSRSFVATSPFVLPEAKGGASWVDRDTLLLISTAEGPATTSGYARTVRLWQRGTPPADAPVIFAVADTHMSAWASYERATGRFVFADQIGFYDVRMQVGDRTGPHTPIDVPTDVAMDWHGDWIALRPRTAWTVGGETHPPDTVLGMALAPFLAGERLFQIVFRPEARRALQGFTWVRGRLLVSVLDNLRAEHLVVHPADGWRVGTLRNLPPIGTVNVWPLDGDEDEATGELLALTQTPVDPPALLLTDLSSAPPTVLRRAPATYDSSGAVVTQHEAVSSDGERIPYVQVGPPAVTGDEPVYMTGYGGFNVPILPAYLGRAGKLWVEKGGTFVSASIRGGGEFGTPWHEAGRRERKRLAHDDFAAVAADLVRRGVTTPRRIAAEGGSNGGLLIANMLTRFPERFGALFCTIPLIDMRRYHRLLAGASWMAEYGNPDLPEDWAFIRPMSAYHAAEPNRPYPPILIATTRRDDRVHPGHARKMAAKLQALGYDALFYEPAAGGHGYGKDNAEAASFSALGMRFLRRAIGWDGNSPPAAANPGAAQAPT